MRDVLYDLSEREGCQDFKELHALKEEKGKEASEMNIKKAVLSIILVLLLFTVSWKARTGLISATVN